MLGLYALALAGIGIAFGGLVTTSFAGEIIALLVILTFVIDTVVPALKLAGLDPAARADRAPRPPDGRAVGLARDGAARGDRRGRAPARDLGRQPARRPALIPTSSQHAAPGTRPAPFHVRRPRPRPRLAGVDPAALVAIAIAAVLHAAWNILLKTAGDPLRTATAGVVASSAILVPLVAIGWLVLGRPSIPPRRGSSGRSRARSRSRTSCSSPRPTGGATCRSCTRSPAGTAPLLAVSLGVVVLGERLAPAAWLGVGLLVAGLLVVQRPWRLLGSATARDDRVAAGFAILTGAMIASYSALDRVGVQLAPAWFYAGILWPVCARRAAGRGVGPAADRRRARSRRPTSRSTCHGPSSAGC